MMASADLEHPTPLSIGARVRLKRPPEYLKTADSRPMLRPPDLVDVGEIGQVMALKPGNELAVRFRRGSFLLRADQLSIAETEELSG